MLADSEPKYFRFKDIVAAMRGLEEQIKDPKLVSSSSMGCLRLVVEGFHAFRCTKVGVVESYSTRNRGAVATWLL